MVNSLFLGAGASLELGIPLVWELTNELKNWLTPDKLRSFNKGWITQGGGWTDSTVDLVIDILSIKSMHYESLIGAIETEINREKNGSRYQELHGVRSWFIEMIYHLFFYRQIKNEVYITSILPDFLAIKKFAEESKPLWVFSLNHDINLEIIATYFGIPIKCGFKSKIELPRRDRQGKLLGNMQFEYLSREDLDNNAFDFFKNGEYGINLIKLHGSLDIFAKGDELNLLKIWPTVFNPSGFIESLRQANEELNYIPFTKVTNEIAYADENGVMQFLRRSLITGAHKFEGTGKKIGPSEFFKLFDLYIGRADNMICIGYSFSDAHVDTVIRNWLERKKENKLTIVNPSAKDCPSILAHLQTQIESVGKGCIEYLRSIDDSNNSIERSFFRELRKIGRRRLNDKFSQPQQKAAADGYRRR